MATQVFHGLNIHWGTGTTNLTASTTPIPGVIMSVDCERKVEESEIKSQMGATQAWIGYNTTKEATFEYVAFDTDSPSGDATVIQPSQGDFLECKSDELNFTGSKWIVKSVSEKALNTDATKVTIRATLYPLIQGN